MRVPRLVVFMALMVIASSRPSAAASWPAMTVQNLLVDSDCEAVPGFTGYWNSQSDLDGTWTIERLKNGHYQLLQSNTEYEPSKQSAFDICVGHLGGSLFFDATFHEFTPAGPDTHLGDEDIPFWIPLHFIGRLEIEDEVLHFLLLDGDWLQGEIASGRTQIGQSQGDAGDCLITASTEELKQFAVRFETETNAFSYAEEFGRLPDQEEIRLEAGNPRSTNARQSLFPRSLSSLLRFAIPCNYPRASVCCAKQNYV